MVVRTKTSVAKTGASATTRKPAKKSAGRPEAPGPLARMMGEAVGHAIGQAQVITDANGMQTSSLRCATIEANYVNGRSAVTVKTIGHDGKEWVKKIASG
jgi:hypothetical protein